MGDRVPDRSVPVKRDSKDRTSPRRVPVPRRPSRLETVHPSGQDNGIVFTAMRVESAPDFQEVVGHADTSVELAIGVEDLECAMSCNVAHDNPSVLQNRQLPGKVELARTVALPPDRPDESTFPVDDHHRERVDIQQVDVARTVEGDFVDPPELLPIFPCEGADPVDLFEISLQPAVVGGELDDLLGHPGRGGHQTARQCNEVGEDEGGLRHASIHSVTGLCGGRRAQFTVAGSRLTTTVSTSNSSVSMKAARPSGPNAAGICASSTG